MTRESLRRYPVKKWCITGLLLAVLLGMAGYSSWKGSTRNKLVYADSLELSAARVGGEELTLRQLAFYVAYEEAEVERQAYIYDPKDTNRYWNLHANGTYIRLAARNAAIQMAIHDELFYQMALAEGISLNDGEQELLSQRVDEFWNDLADYGKDERLGVEKGDIARTMEKIAYAEKMQYIYEMVQGQNEGDYAFCGDAYLEFLDRQDYRIYEKVWGRVNFGNVTLTHWET